MAETVKIGDIANQLSTASRLVVSTDFFWIYMADGSQVKIPAEFVRAYLTDSIKPTVGSDGTWQIGGSSTGVKAEGVSPQLKAVDEGINVSYDGGTTWQTLVLYSQMDIGLDGLVATYKNIISTEQERVDAETARQSAETKRQEAETARVTAETERQSQFEASKTAADEATAKANSTYSHPPYVDSDGYYYKWNVATESYDKTDVNLTGKAFQIKKVFASVSAMEATSVDTFDENDFLLINTSDVEDEDNAKLYVVAVNSDTGKKFYSYLVDMSGFRGFTGKTPQFYIGTVTTLATGSTASASLTSDGTDTDGNPKYKLNLAIPKGDKLTLADLTDDDIAELQKPATDAIALCNTATDKANTATSNANTATDKANTAASNATTAAGNASKINDTVTTAEAARVTAENARVSAENARATAEASRTSAETARGKAEDTRVSNESSRQNSETSRQSNETSRQNAETARANAEASRATAEKARVTAETQRQSDFSASKSACDTATANAKTATTNSETQTALAKELNEHPMYVGEDNYVYRWDSTAKAYTKTTVYVKGDKGDTGATGSTGAKGDKGDNGSSPKIVNGTWWIYNDTKGEYENSGISVSSDYTLTKAKVEAVLTGDIASHTHSQYAETDDVTTELGKKADQTSLDAAVTRIASLESGSATTIETTGTGNAITAIAKSGTKITATKGTTFLTSHQDISGKSDKTHTHSVKINGTTKTIAATGGTAVDLGTYLTSHQDISGKADKATTLAGYGITDAAAKSHTHIKSDITDLSLDFSSVTGKPTTLAGYGITDAKIESGKITLGSSSITPLTSHQSLSGYAKTTDIPTKVSQLTNDAGYLTEHQSLDGYYTKTEVDTKVDGFATQDWVSSQGYAKGTVPTKTSQLTNDSGYITADDLKETVTITLASNQSSTDTSLNGATVTVKDGSSTIGTYTWDGNAITLEVAGSQSLTVSVSAVTGYKTPSSQTFITLVGNSRAITMTYQTEVVTVTVSASNGASMSGQKITVNGTAYTYSSAFSVKIPYGTYYTVSANDKSGYSTPSAQTFTANQATRSVTLTYTYNPTGVYILDTDGNLTTAANWNTANNSKAVGVFVGTDNCKFVIAPDSDGTSTWGGYGTTISGIVTTIDSTTAKKDYAGSANTDKIISQLGASNAKAANYCKSYTFKNGKSGYLWSLGEMQAAYDNKSAIDTALSKIGATAMSTSYYWTSTQYDSYYAWILDWRGGNVNYYTKNNGTYVRAVCAF